MIQKREILQAAQQTSLTPHVVEKDYVLGWVLAGIYQQEDLAQNWIFKGGTCLKKCFFKREIVAPAPMPATSSSHQG